MTPLPESLVSVVQALVADEDLALWFEALAGIPAGDRMVEFRQMAARMRAAGSDADLTSAIAVLAAPGVYQDVLNAFHALRDQEA